MIQPGWAGLWSRHKKPGCRMVFSGPKVFSMLEKLEVLQWFAMGVGNFPDFDAKLGGAEATLVFAGGIGTRGWLGRMGGARICDGVFPGTWRLPIRERLWPFPEGFSQFTFLPDRGLNLFGTGLALRPGKWCFTGRGVRVG